MNNANKNRLKKILEKLSGDERNFVYNVISQDPLSNIYSKLFLLYFVLISFFLLWPFDFISFPKNDTQWIQEKNGIEFQKTGQIISVSPTNKFYNYITKNSSLTIEICVETKDITQSGLARIFSYSKNKEISNFVIGQAWDKLVIRLRTTKTNQKGTSPHLVINDVFNSKSFQHIVIIYNSNEQRVYINDELKARSNVLQGILSNWDISCKLILGNETTGDRPWKGKIFYVAVYSNALTEQEIHYNYLSRNNAMRGISDSTSFKKKQQQTNVLEPKRPLIEYLFDEKKGNMIHDSGLGLTPINMIMPEYIKPTNKRLLNFSPELFHYKSRFADIILNILIFIPIGILINGTLRTRYGLKPRIAIITALSGTFLSVGFECLQYFSIDRNSSLIDVITNMTGTILGVFLDISYHFHLRYRARHIKRAL